MSSRKRPLPDEDDSVATKKRILTGANGGPHVNGSASDEEEEAFGDNLEAYRKEAIYRKMKHYCREHERSQAQIRELEKRKTTCEAGVAAISACWAQLLETIRLFVKSDDLPEVDISSTEIFDLASHMREESMPELNSALSETANATKALVTKFVQLGDKRSDILQNRAFPECRKAQDECIVLHSELDLLRTKLKESEAQKENYHNALLAAENRYARSVSATVKIVEAKGSDDGEGTEKEKGDAERALSSPAPSSVAPPTPAIPHSHPNGHNHHHDDSAHEVEVLREHIKARDNKIVELEKEMAILKDERTMLELEQKAPSFEHFKEQPHFQIMADYIAFADQTIAEKTEAHRRLEEDLLQATTGYTDLQKSIYSLSNNAMEEMKSMIAKKDIENARLRDQRDQQNSELVERRTRDQMKFASIQEMKNLVESNGERIKVLQSELSRCKARLAAAAGSEDLLAFFLGGNHEEAQFFEKLRTEKEQAQSRVAALEQTLAGYSADNNDNAKLLASHSEALEQLSQTKKELEHYRQTFGDPPHDISRLAEQLKAKEAELEILRLKERAQRETEETLYNELAQLTTSWEAVERQLKSKVLDLSAIEDRLLKLGYEKAKSDNKFYAAMREKDAIETERKNLARNLEKQGKVIDRQRDIEDMMEKRINSVELETNNYKKANDALLEKLGRLERDLPDIKVQLDMEKRRVQELTTLMSEREVSLQHKKLELRGLEDDFIRQKKELEKQVAQAKRDATRTAGTSTAKPNDVNAAELENSRALIRCSTCRGPIRTTIITKCMHTFCRGCIDARLNTRQRKCPACGVAFGASDVHNFFFQ